MPTPLQNINAEKIKGNLSITSVSATTYYNLPIIGDFTGGTVTGATTFTNGLTANTISATTYFNLPISTDIFVTGGTYSNGSAIFTNNTGGTFNVNGFYTGSTDIYTTGATYSNNNFLFTNNTGGTFSTLFNTVTGLTVNGLLKSITLSATSINTVDYIVFNTGTTSATTVAGTVYFDNTEKALSYNTSINQGVTVNLGQQNYLRVFNNSGVDIARGKALEVLSAYSGLPSVTLAINKHTGFNIIGVSAEIIPNGKEGVAITNGIISNIELTGMSVGSFIYASDKIAGQLVDGSKYLNFPLTARTNQIGYVVQTGNTIGKLFININNENSALSLTDLERNVLEGNTLSTGVFEYTGMVKTSSTTFNIAPLKGWIVQNTYENALKPNAIAIEYNGVTGQTTPYLLTDVATYALINSGSTLTLQNTFPTAQQRRENIFLGRIAHPDKTTIVTVNNTIDFDVSPMSALRDLWTPLKLVNENVLVSPNGANLNFNTSSGTLWGNGIGWVENQLNPNSINITGSTPATFQYRVQTGGTYSDTTIVDPAYYDLNGIRTLIGGGSNSSTNQRIYLYPNRQYRVQYGQKVYSSLSQAIVGVQTESFVTFVNNRDNAILIGILSINKNATTLNNTSEAVFSFVSKFGELLGGTGGISTTTLQQAYDNSTTPEIIINSILDGLSIKNGTGNSDNTTRLFEGINTIGGITSFISADGSISGTTLQTDGFTGNSAGISALTINIRTVGSGTSITNLGVDVFGNIVSGVTGGSGATFTGGTVSGPTTFTNGLTANTISATTYYNLPTDIRVTGATYSNNNLLFTNNTGGTFSTLFNTMTGLTISGNLTVTGGTQSLFSGNSSVEMVKIIQNGSGDAFVVEDQANGDASHFVINASGNTAIGLTQPLSNDKLTVSGNTNIYGGLTATTLSSTYGMFSGAGQNVLTVIGSGNSTTSPIFSIQGSQGELFSVTDSLIGSLFSVNDISGLPILEVFSDNTTLMGSYQAPSLNTTTKVTLTAGTNTIYSIPVSAYTGAFFDYTVISSGSTGARAGNIMAIWSGTTTQYSETSTNDIGDTAGITFSVAVSGNNAVLSSSATTAGWTLKTIIRTI